MTSTDKNKYIIDHYLDQTRKEMAKNLGISISSVANRMTKLREKGLIKIKPTNSGRFKKGNAVWNKGMKGYSPNNHSTRFKKGSKPYNTHQEGKLIFRDSGNDRGWFISFGGRKKMIIYKNYVWEQAYGKPPKGYVIRRLDGDNRNDCLDNLICVSRAEHVRMNSNEKKRTAAVRKAKAANKDLECDTLIASFLAYQKPELKQHILNHHPELIEMKRNQLKLKRSIRRKENERSKRTSETSR